MRHQLVNKPVSWYMTQISALTCVKIRKQFNRQLQNMADHSSFDRPKVPSKRHLLIKNAFVIVVRINNQIYFNKSKCAKEIIYFCKKLKLKANFHFEKLYFLFQVIKNFSMLLHMFSKILKCLL